jgi:hypothetical protein
VSAPKPAELAAAIAAVVRARELLDHRVHGDRLAPDGDLLAVEFVNEAGPWGLLWVCVQFARSLWLCGANPDEELAELGLAVARLGTMDGEREHE